MPRCNLCNNFERSIRDYCVTFDFVPDQLDLSARNGCPFCALLRNSIMHFESKIGLHNGLRQVCVRGPTVDEKRVTVEMDLYTNDSRNLTLEIFRSASK